MTRMGEAETDHSVQLRTGRSIPILGLGTSPMRGREAYDAVRFALEAGYRLIDTATSYRNQEEVGRAIRDSGLAREEIFITTKVPGEPRSRAANTGGQPGAARHGSRRSLVDPLAPGRRSRS